jgi:dUTP pyrophosphatase
VNFFKMISQAVGPRRATAGSACCDLYSCLGPDGLDIAPNQRIAIPTGIILEIPEKHVVKVFARSGLSLKKGLVLANSVGIIDHDYREELFILMMNVSGEVQHMNHGERIAQMMLEKVLDFELTETTNQPSRIESRDGGMGSTGKE